MTATWVDAVREYAKQTGKWSVPKKDTDEYKAIKAIQEKMKNPPPAVEPKKRGRKPKAEAPVAEPVAPVKQDKKVAIEAPKQEAPVVAVEKKSRAKKEAPVAEVAPAVPKKKVKEPRVTIEDKKVILTFD